ncbi:MAG TPA: peptidase S15, partial [Gammaproteobacteria bacterium]|nr:peptidase S15 [Gammaproteobacteria bacterium]
RVFTGASELVLPTRPPREEDSDLPAVPDPAGAPLPEISTIEPPDFRWRILRELEANSFTLEVHDTEGVYRVEHVGTEVEYRGIEHYTIIDNDFRSPRGRVQRVMGFRRGDWDVRTVTETELTADPGNFYIRATLDAYEDGESVYHQEWDLAIPRDHI